MIPVRDINKEKSNNFLKEISIQQWRLIRRHLNKVGYGQSSSLRRFYYETAIYQLNKELRVAVYQHLDEFLVFN